MTPDINKAMTNHDTLIKEATQLTEIVNLLDKPPDTDVPIQGLRLTFISTSQPG